jgi:hypothetical protein
MTHRIFTTRFASVYPLYLAKAERKGRSRDELDQILCWLTGYAPEDLTRVLQSGDDFQTFFRDAPALNPQRDAVRGVICGVRIEDIEEPLMREIRILDKLVDELARGQPMEKILRRGPGG